MIASISAATFERFGKPAEVIGINRLELPDPKPNEVLVKTRMAPINPADLNVLEGTYAVLPDSFPAVAGIESVGVIAKKGVAVPELKTEQMVICPLRQGTWCDAFVVPHQQLVPVPPGIPVDQAAMLSINPPTAWRMLHDFVHLKPGDWIIQNAANSAVGRHVIQIAKHKFIKTVSVVRRPELVDELKAEGGDVVVVHDENLRGKVWEATGDAKIMLGLNATGGRIMSDMVKCLAQSATLVTYGAMAKEPFRLNNGAIIFKDIRARGFWITNWYRNARGTDVKEMFSDIANLAKTGVIKTPIEARYSLADVVQAVEHAERESRSGKILLEIG